ncbi:MAG: hypothetical protein U0002_21500 [Thermoanaerobaculia bacterium]
MQLRKLLEKWDLNSLKITLPFLAMEWVPRDEDRAAAWELYVEMITRVTTASLTPGTGQEAAALASVHQLFPLTRGILKQQGRYCINFAKIAVPVLNQAVRPFTSKWHGRVGGAALSEEETREFRTELARLQTILLNYTRLLADLAGVEDLTALEAQGSIDSAAPAE